MPLSFIGIGLTGLGLTIEGLREAQKATFIYIDTYTNMIPHNSFTKLKKVIGKDIAPLSRSDLEGKGMEKIIELAKKSDVALLIAGDPFIATTHIALKIEAIKAGVHVKYIPSASIQSVVPGLTGLSSYKFGRSATVVFKDKGPSDTAYEAIRDNKIRGLHTLLYLDLDAETSRAMTIREALEILLEIEERRREEVMKSDMLIVGIARACWDNCLIKALKLSEALDYDFGPPPHTLVIPGPLHFMELEALKVLAGLEVR